MDVDDPVRPPGDGTLDADPGPGPGGGDVRWKLRRGEGSEWTVTGLSLAPDGVRVSGYRYVRDRDAPAESRREVLDGELLRTEDRVWCLDRSGAVVWRLTSPRGDRERGAEAVDEASPGRAFPGTPGSGDPGRPAGGGPIGG